MPTPPTLRKDLKAHASSARAKVLARYFKTGPGEYGEGDVFMGVRVPDIRRVATRHKDMPLSDIAVLLESDIHEERMTALVILTLQYARGDEGRKKDAVDMYVAHTTRINNWDLVDVSVHKIIGAWVRAHSKEEVLLKKWAKSAYIWERRMAIVATFHHIREGELSLTLTIADMLLKDTHDLIHKAVGWALREVGKKDEDVLREYIRTRYERMPRTTLRYAIERFPEKERKRYLAGNV